MTRLLARQFFVSKHYNIMFVTLLTLRHNGGFMANYFFLISEFGPVVELRINTKSGSGKVPVRLLDVLSSVPPSYKCGTTT